MKKHIISLSILLLGIFCGGTAIIPVFAQTTGSQDINVSVSIVFPVEDDIPQAALKPNDFFAVRIEAPDAGISQVSVNFDELGIGIEPLSDSNTGIFQTRMHALPYKPSGLKHYSVFFRDAYGTQHDITKAVLVDAEAPTGQVTATFSKIHDSYSIHVSGSIAGTGSDARVVDAFMYSVDQNGTRIPEQHLDDLSTKLQTPLSFSIDVPIQTPDSSWAAIGYAITIRDAAANTAEIYSEATPVESIESGPRINHALSGSIVEPKSVEEGGDIPSGVWIPHSLINSLSEGDYYAVVFFEGLVGCPTSNYTINAFHTGLWGADLAGPGVPDARAKSTSAGGCMQYFHVDPKKGDEWYWGALDPSSYSKRAIADSAGVPAFALCDEASTCDVIAPQIDGDAMSNDPAESLTSSVLFLPGVKGTRLYENNPLCLFPTLSCDIPLWLPLGDILAQELFLDASGKSVRSVYAKEDDILQSAFSQNFYATFAQSMNEAVSGGTYGLGWSWKPVAYDWRMSLADVVHNGSVFKDRIYYEDIPNTPYIEQALRTLAASSPTRKVTIIAHSNGGLVAKALIQKLGDAEAGRLIDKVVLVGVPQSGAPRAVGALLYGDAEGIPGTGRFPNLILSPAHAREFALNSPAAYHLLPSANYMSLKNESYPLIHFESSPLLERDRTLYGDTIDTADELTQYILGDAGARSAPVKTDLSNAAVGNKTLLRDAQNTHTSLDAWVPPAGIEVYQIAGYGVDTISGFDIYEAPTKSSRKSIAYRPLFTQDGDGTVPIISSLMLNESEHIHTSWVDMSRLSTGKTFSHGNMFEAPEIEEVIKNILHRSGQSYVVNSVNSEMGETHKRISVYIHSSSASISVHDSAGNSTEIHANTSSQNDIPGSTSGTIGEVSYITLPANETYTLSVTGTGPGTVTLDLEDRTGSIITASSTIAEIPTTTSTAATLTIQNSIAHSSTLQIDEDGDGKADYSAAPQLGMVVFPIALPKTEQTYISTPHIIIQSPTASEKITPLPITLASPLGFSTTTAARTSSVSSTTHHAIFLQETASIPQYSASTHTVRDTPIPDVGGTSTIQEVPVSQTPEVKEERHSWWLRILQFLKKIARAILKK